MLLHWPRKRASKRPRAQVSPVLQYRATDNGGPREGGLLSGCHLLRADDYCCFRRLSALWTRLGVLFLHVFIARHPEGRGRKGIRDIGPWRYKEETAAERSESERERRARQEKPGTRGAPGSEPGAAGSLHQLTDRPARCTNSPTNPCVEPNRQDTNHCRKTVCATCTRANCACATHALHQLTRATRSLHLAGRTLKRVKIQALNLYMRIVSNEIRTNAES